MSLKTIITLGVFLGGAYLLATQGKRLGEAVGTGTGQLVGGIFSGISEGITSGLEPMFQPRQPLYTDQTPEAEAMRQDLISKLTSGQMEGQTAFIGTAGSETIQLPTGITLRSQPLYAPTEEQTASEESPTSPVQPKIETSKPSTKTYSESVPISTYPNKSDAIRHARLYKPSAEWSLVGSSKSGNFWEFEFQHR